MADAHLLPNDAFAKKIESQLKWFYGDPARMKKLFLGDVISMMKYITTRKSTDENETLFDAVFIKHIQLIMDLTKLHFNKAEMHFKTASKVLVLDCGNEIGRYEYVEKLVTEWIEYAQSMPSQYRIRVFESLFEQFKKVALSLVKIGCFSLQTKLLRLIRIYMDDQLQRQPFGILDLFDGVLSDKSPYIRLFKAWTTQNDELKNMVLFRGFLLAINNKNKRVESNILSSVEFDCSTITTYPEIQAWVDFNRGNSSIEFSIQERELELEPVILVTIDRHNLHSMEFRGPEYDPSEITFILNNCLTMKSESTIEMFKYERVRSVKMKIFRGYIFEHMSGILSEMFPTIPQKKKFTVEKIELLSKHRSTAKEATNPFENQSFKKSTKRKLGAELEVVKDPLLKSNVKRMKKMIFDSEEVSPIKVYSDKQWALENFSSPPGRRATAEVNYDGSVVNSDDESGSYFGDDKIEMVNNDGKKNHQTIEPNHMIATMFLNI